MGATLLATAVRAAGVAPAPDDVAKPQPASNIPAPHDSNTMTLRT
jgi:hypothetical protein